MDHDVDQRSEHRQQATPPGEIAGRSPRQPARDRGNQPGQPGQASDSAPPIRTDQSGQNRDRDQGRGSGGGSRQGQSDGGGRSQKRPSGSGVQGENRDGRRRRKDGSDRRGLFGFGDQNVRSTCLSQRHIVPEEWPVHSRSEFATLRMVEVARRPEEILFCDGDHLGPHIWPDGEFIDENSPQSSDAVPPRTEVEPTN